MVTGLEADIITKLIMAAFLGGLVGLEREVYRIPAGMRTHALLCMGSALFTILSITFVAPSDPSRIAAGIVTGIGFLAAGAIFRAEDRVRGLTTAAELWVTAAIGVAVGIGLYYAAVVATVIVIIILLPMKFVEKEALNKKKK